MTPGRAAAPRYARLLSRQIASPLPARQLACLLPPCHPATLPTRQIVSLPVRQPAGRIRRVGDNGLNFS
jgi:hypothetical protein